MTISDRMRGLSTAMGAACSLLLGGCASIGLLDWGHDEVTVHAGMIEVKNVPTLEDGGYFLAVPTDWGQQAVHPSEDGVLELSSPMSLSLQRQRQGSSPHDIGFTPFLFQLDVDDVRPDSAFEDVPAGAIGACVEERSGRRFHVGIFGADPSRRRWIRLGVIDVGPGSQSGLRQPLSYVGLPFAVAADVVLVPLGLIIKMFAEGLRAAFG
jgi:hypothetical protein